MMHAYALSVADIQQGGVFYMQIETQQIFLNGKIKSFHCQDINVKNNHTEAAPCLSAEILKYTRANARAYTPWFSLLKISGEGRLVEVVEAKEFSSSVSSELKVVSGSMLENVILSGVAATLCSASLPGISPSL